MHGLSFTFNLAIILIFAVSESENNESAGKTSRQWSQGDQSKGQYNALVSSSGMLARQAICFASVFSLLLFFVLIVQHLEE